MTRAGQMIFCLGINAIKLPLLKKPLALSSKNWVVRLKILKLHKQLAYL